MIGVRIRLRLGLELGKRYGKHSQTLTITQTRQTAAGVINHTLLCFDQLCKIQQLQNKPQKGFANGKVKTQYLYNCWTS